MTEDLARSEQRCALVARISATAWAEVVVETQGRLRVVGASAPPGPFGADAIGSTVAADTFLRSVIDASGEPYDDVITALREATPHDVVLVGYGKDGSPCSLRVVIAREPDARAIPLPRLLVATREVPRVTDASEALAASERRFRWITEMTQQVVYEGVLHADDSFTMHWLTERGVAATGLSRGQPMTSSALQSNWHPQDREQRIARIAKLRAGERDSREIRILAPTGEWLWIQMTEQPDGPALDGSGLRVFGSVRNVTAARREAELVHELQQAREQLEERLLNEMQLAEARPVVRQPTARVPNDGDAFGVSPAMAAVRELAHIATEHREPVLLTGETGTGKGFLADWIHRRRPDARGTFVGLNCSAMRGELLLSELFGSARGAYTSATRDRKGVIEVADGGTLFLDEIGDMPLDVQGMVLKVLEEKSFRRLGESVERTSQFRLMTATHRDLEVEVREGRFRRDLLYRINVFPIAVPALRDRIEDLPLLVRQLCESLEVKTSPLPDETLELLQAQRWPGNIRQLRNALIRAILLARGAPLHAEHFAGLLPPTPSEREPAHDEVPNAGLEQRLRALLQEHGDNRTRVAQELGVSRTSLYRYLARFGLGSGGRPR